MSRRLYRGLIAAGCLTLLAPLPAPAAVVQALFDLDAPSGGPFPSDRFTEPDDSQNTGLRVALPQPAECEAASTPRPSACRDVETLNTLDGFNLQPRLSIPFSGPIDVQSVGSESVFLVGPDGHRIGIDQVVWDVETNTLHVEADELLDQHTRYLLIVSRGVRDAVGDPVEASGAFQALRHGQKVGQADDDSAVTAYRAALLAGLEGAAAAGVDLNRVAVASVFTTQSITATLEQIRDQIKAATPEPADFALGPGGTRTVFPLGAIQDLVFRRQLTADPRILSPMSLAAVLNVLRQTFPGAVGQIAFGKYRSPDYLTPCSTVPCDRFIPPVGTRTGGPVVQGEEEIFFNLFLPSGSPPPRGWPVLIFGFGTGDTKNNAVLRIASTMAAHGLALVVTNGVGLGLGPASTLTVSLDEDRNGVPDRSVTFPAGGRSFDQNGDGLIGTGVFPTSEGAETLPVGTFISRRDPRRQTVADLMQLVRVIEVGVDVDGDGTADLDPSRIYYFGFSHGADHGIMFVATEPLVRAAVLTGGGGNVDAFRLSPGNRVAVGRYLEKRVPPLVNAPGIANLAGLSIAPPRFHENFPLREELPLAVALADGTAQTIESPVINILPGAMDIQRVIDQTQWVLQSADGSAYAPYLRRSPLRGVPAKSVIMQFARGDQTIPNPGTTALIRSGDLADRATLFRNDLAFAANPTGFTRNGHMFVIPVAPPPTPDQTAVALAAQRQIAEFFAWDGARVIDPDGPCLSDGSGCLFEVPIEGPLPEDLGFIP